MSKTDNYYQFPISCLAYANTVKERMNDLTGWCVVDTGKKTGDKLQNEGREDAATGILERYCISHNMQYDAEVTERNIIIIGLATLGVKSSSIDALASQHKRVDAFISGMAAQHGPAPLVRVRHDLYWQAVDDASEPGTGMSWRQFSVLCGVYAILGNKQYMRICRDRIQAAALGYKSTAVMKSHLRQRLDKAMPLTINQIRTTLDRLESDGFFCRVHASPRRTFFSNRIDRNALVSIAIKRESGRAVRLLENRASDRQVSERIRQLKSGKIQHHNITAKPPCTQP